MLNCVLPNEKRTLHQDLVPKLQDGRTCCAGSRGSHVVWQLRFFPSYRNRVIRLSRVNWNIERPVSHRILCFIKLQLLVTDVHAYYPMTSEPIFTIFIPTQPKQLLPRPRRELHVALWRKEMSKVKKPNAASGYGIYQNVVSGIFATLHFRSVKTLTPVSQKLKSLPLLL